MRRGQNTSGMKTPDGMKWCPRGGGPGSRGHFAHIAEFAKYTSRWDGLAPYCKQHMQAYKRSWARWTMGEDRRLLEAKREHGR